MTRSHFSPQMEIWKPVPSAPQYVASSLGRIMVVPYISSMPKGGTRRYGGFPYLGVWSETDKRYIVVYKGKTFKVHRLVCEAFHGPPTDDEPNVLHIDEDSSNNKSENLKWGSQKENLNAPKFLEYCRSRVGEESSVIKGRKRNNE